MIDNFELIKPLFYFNEANNMFFHCQIVRRAKDHKPDKVKEGAIKTYFIRSREHLESNDCWCEDCKDRTKLKQI